MTYVVDYQTCKEQVQRFFKSRSPKGRLFRTTKDEENWFAEEGITVIGKMDWNFGEDRINRLVFKNKDDYVMFVLRWT